MSINAEISFDFQAIDTILSGLSEEYQSASPFPHVAIDQVFDQDLLRTMVAEFPTPENMPGAFHGEIEGGKFTESNFSAFGPATQAFFGACNSGTFLQSLSRLTGIPGLIADPYLAGGGQHQTATHGRLKVHSDFNVHPFLNLTRRVNMLVYLNENWEPSWGGELELWDVDMTRAVVKVPPRLGQVVIFNTTDTSFHGLPDPIQFPPGQFRRSLAFYYFTSDSETPDPRSTLWKERPSDDFLSRPSARIKTAGGHINRAIKTLLGK